MHDIYECKHANAHNRATVVSQRVTQLLLNWVKQVDCSVAHELIESQDLEES